MHTKHRLPFRNHVISLISSTNIFITRIRTGQLSKAKLPHFCISAYFISMLALLPSSYACHESQVSTSKVYIRFISDQSYLAVSLLLAHRSQNMNLFTAKLPKPVTCAAFHKVKDVGSGLILGLSLDVTSLVAVAAMRPGSVVAKLP